MPATTLPTIRDAFQRDSVYWGDRADWSIAYSTHRDADCLNRSNYRCFLKLLGAKGTEGANGSQDISENVAIEEAHHWAVGWVQRIVVNPAATDLIALVQKTLEDLEDYPVLNEDDFSELETEEANDIWSQCYDVSERVAYIRKYPSQFEFRDFADMLGCVRGQYFPGYASELIG